MFLHLLLGDLQVTPVVARHLGNQYKLLQCLKLEVIHENQLIEYGLISKDSKFESLFPFQQTIHIPLDNYFATIDRLTTDEDLHNSNLQKLSFTIFAVLGREQLVKLGTGVLTSSLQKDSKVVSKTVIFRNDQFELIAKLALNIAYHESLLDISDLLQLKQNNTIPVKQQQEQEYAFLLSRKFRRSEADFPATFDFKLDRKLEEDTKYYIEGKNKKTKCLAESEKRTESTGKERLTGSTGRKSSPKHVRRPERESSKKLTDEKNQKYLLQPRSASKSRRKAEHLAEEAPKLRKTAMTVGFVHNNWPDPLQHEKEKKEFQLRMADERKQLLLQQIRQEIDLQRQRASYVQEQHRHQEEIKKEKKRKKQLAKELQNRELEIKKLQEELQNIRFQSLLSAQKSSPPPPTAPPRYHSPLSSNHHRSNQTSNPRASSSDKKRRSASSPSRVLEEKQKKKIPSPSTQSKKPSNRVASFDQRIDQLINSHYGNFFKQVTPQPKVQKVKESPVAKRILSSYDKLKSYQSKGSPVLAAKSAGQSKHSSNKVEHGNNVIKVSITRSPTPKISKTGPIAARYQSFVGKHEKEREAKEKSLKRRDTFEFHEVYHQMENDHHFDSDYDFAQLSQEYPKSASKISAKKALNQSSRYDLDEMNSLDDNADHLLLFEKSMMDEMSAIHRAIESKSDEQQNIRQEAALLVSSLNPMTSVNEFIRTESTNEAYKVPGFLHTMVQQPKSSIQSSAYYDNLDMEENDDDDVSDSDFERRFNLQTDEELEDDESVNQLIKSEPSANVDSKRQIELSSLDPFILPARDFNYSEASYTQKSSTISYHPPTAYERTYSLENDLDYGSKAKDVEDYYIIPSYGENLSNIKSDITNVEERLDSRGRSEFEFRHSRSGHQMTSETTTARSRSREKALQRLERNRQYSSPSGKPQSVSVVGSSTNEFINTTSTAVTTTSTTSTTASIPDNPPMVNQQIRSVHDDDADDDDYDDDGKDEQEEDQLSQLDAVLRRTSEEITNAVKNVSIGTKIYSSIRDHKKNDASANKSHQQIDISLSDDDTIENNILDTVTFNAKLMKSFSSDSEEKAKKDMNSVNLVSETQTTASMLSVPTVTDAKTKAASDTTNGEKNDSSSALSSRSGSFDENKIINAYFTDSESDNVEDEEEERALSNGREKVNGTEEKSEKGLFFESEVALQSKLDRISTRINTLFSESSIDLKHLVSKDLLSGDTNNNSANVSSEVTPLSTNSVKHDFNSTNAIGAVKSPLSEKRSVSFASKIEEVHEIISTDPNFMNGTSTLKKEQEIDYTKPKTNYSLASNRSLIERQFEKNRKYSSAVNSSSGSLSNGSATNLPPSSILTTDSIESLRIESSHIIPEIKIVDPTNHHPSVSAASNQPTGKLSQSTNGFPESVSNLALTDEEVLSDNRLISGSNAEAPSLDPDQIIFKEGTDVSHSSSQLKTTEEEPIVKNQSHVKSIITQFEKNQKYTSSSAYLTVESISHPSMKVSPQSSLLKRFISEDSSKNQNEREIQLNIPASHPTFPTEVSLPFPSFIPTFPNLTCRNVEESALPKLNGHVDQDHTTSIQSEFFISTTGSGTKTGLQTEWNEIEAALDKLEVCYFSVN